MKNVNKIINHQEIENSAKLIKIFIKLFNSFFNLLHVTIIITTD